MPRPGQHIKCTYVGTLPQGEIFQTGFWIDATGAGVTLAELQGLATDIASSFIAGSASIRSLTGTATRYEEVRLYNYPDPGPAPAQDIAVAPIALTGLAGNTGNLPLQCALVVSLRTALVGRRYRGRMYWPVNTHTLVDHQAPQTTIDGMVANTDVMMENVNTYDGGRFQAVVMSSVASTSTEITSVTCDSRLDVQRRRAENQAELRQATAQVTI